MEYDQHGKNYGWLKFLEHWNIAIIPLAAMVASLVLPFLSKLNGQPWIWFCSFSFALMVLGGGFIGYAKYPVYRTGRFFTFGVKSIPTHLTKWYRLGWWIFLVGVLLSCCLLILVPEI